MLSSQHANSQVIKISLQEMSQQSDLILRVQTLSAESRWVTIPEGKNIITTTRFRVLESIKGDILKDEEFTLDMAGGKVGDITQVVSNSVGFTVGEESVIFLPRNKDHLTGSFQGKFTVTGGNVWVENRQVSSSLFVETLRKANENPEAIPLLLNKEKLVPYKPTGLKGAKVTTDTYAITGTKVNFNGTIDNDSDGYYSSFSFSIRVNGDADPGPATVYFRINCTTTGQSWVSVNTYVITGNAVDNHDFGFDQSDFTGLITDNIELNFTVDLLDETQNTVLASDATLDGSAIKVDPYTASGVNISSISPSEQSAGTGSTVTITGTGFGASQGTGKVEFFYQASQPKISAPISSWSDTQIVCTVPTATVNGYPGSAGSGPVTVVNNAAQTSNEYSFNITFGYGGTKWSTSSISYKVNENLGSVTGEAQAVQNAASTWSSAGANFSLQYAGAHTNTAAANNGSNDICWGSVSSGETIGLASTWYSGTTITECDIVFNSSLSWNSGSSSHDIETIALHELGHWLNLRDLYGTASAGYDAAKVMYGFSSTGQTKRSLTSAETSGIAWIYGTATTVTISGTIKTAANVPVQGVTLSGLTGSPTTNASGVYSADVAIGFSGTVTPTKTGYTFTPATRTYSSQSSSATNQDYTATATASNIATLSDLKVNGTTVTGFSASVLTYSVVLPAGTSTVPTVTATTTDANATKVITPAAALPGTSTVVVTAQDGTTTKTYSISFTVAKSNVATLSDLKVNGTTVSGFSASVLTYNVVLPYGTSTVPTVTATTTDANATKVITAASSLPGSTTVRVTAEDGTTQKTYTINFTLDNPSSDATLSDLKVNGSQVSGFGSQVLTYSVVLPYGTVTVPTVTATTTHTAATAAVTAAASLPGTTSVLVTAQDGTTTKTYTISFTVAKNNVATLSDLKVNGTTISGFAASVLTYSVVLPFGTVTVPTVTATTTDVNATKVITPASSLPGTTTVLVTAEDGTTTKTYSISFTLGAASNDASLSDLKVNGTTVSGFVKTQLTYSVELPAGTVTVPTVTATTTEATATKVITPAGSLPGTTTVAVTAPDGTTTRTYFVTFSVAKSTVATLSDLKVNGSQVSGFGSQVFTYNVVLDYGTSTVPTVTATTTDANATKVITPAASLPGTTTVLVTAEDGTTTKTYTISFTVAKNTVATLSDIKINGVTVSGFGSQVFNYTVALPYGSTNPPVITVTATDANALTEITMPPSYPGIVTIKVTADDRVTILNYMLAISYGGTGIDENHFLNTITVYPVPSNGDFTLEYSTQNEGRILVSILDVTGRLILEKEFRAIGYLLSERIQIPGSQAGFYFIRVVDGPTVAFKKIIVE